MERPGRVRRRRQNGQVPAATAEQGAVEFAGVHAQRSRGRSSQTRRASNTRHQLHVISVRRHVTGLGLQRGQTETWLRAVFQRFLLDAAQLPLPWLTDAYMRAPAVFRRFRLHVALRVQYHLFQRARTTAAREPYAALRIHLEGQLELVAHPECS